MDVLIRISLYAAAALVLLAANLWFVRNLYTSFAGAGPADRIVPFQIIGKDDDGGRLANAMPLMLNAHLRRIRHEMIDAFAALAPSATSGSNQPLRPPAAPTGGSMPSPDIEIRETELPIGIADRPDPKGVIRVPQFERFRPPDITMNVGGVEVGGLISWAHRRLVQDRLLNMMVFYQGDSASVYGGVRGRSDFNVHLTPEDFGARPSDDDIVAMIAYAIMQQQSRRLFPAFGAFVARDFRDLLRALADVARLNREVALGRPPDAAEYRALLPDLLRLVARARAWQPSRGSSWQPLIRVAAGVAENGDDLGAAIELHRLELALLGGKDAPRREQIERNLVRLREQANAAEQVARAPAGTVPDDELAGRIRELLGVESLEMPGSPTIAVLGGLPSKDRLADDAITVLGEPREADFSNAPYFDSLVRAVRLVAPEADFLFRAGTVWTSAGLIDAIAALTEEKPAILLVTLGPLGGPAYEASFEALADAGTLAVIAAGNRSGQPAPFAGSPLLDRVMVVSAVTLEGRPTEFTQRGEGVFWAPGEDIPVYVASGGTRPEPQKGTTYSAALAAGVAARALAEHPDTAPNRLIEIFRATARPVPGRSEPAILSLQRGLEWLAEGTAEG